MTIEIVNTYGQPHRTSEKNPNHVTGADRYRLPLVAVIAPGTPGFDDMVEYLKNGAQDLHTRPEGYGVVFLESEEHSATYFGPIEQIEQYKRENAGGAATFDPSPGFMVAQWPHGKGWDDLIPPTFWNRAAHGAPVDGVGIVTAFAHNAIPGAEVIVYEYEGRWSTDDATVPMVTHHCTGCHNDTRFSGGDVHENTGPHARRWAARQARQHISGAVRYGVGNNNAECRPRDGTMLRAVNEVAKKMHGTTHDTLPTTEDGYCNTHGPCSVIRDLRAGARPAVFGH